MPAAAEILLLYVLLSLLLARYGIAVAHLKIQQVLNREYCGDAGAVEALYSGKIKTVSNLVTRLKIRLHIPYCKLPLGSFNPYLLGLAASLEEYASALVVHPGRMLTAPTVPLYEESARLLESCSLAAKADLVLVLTLLSRQLFFAGNRSEALRNQLKAVQIYQSMNVKELTESVQAIVLLEEGLILNGKGCDEITSTIGHHALRLIEEAPVDSTPKEQLKLLSLAIKTLAELCRVRNEMDKVEILESRHEKLAAALKSKGVIA